MSPFGGALAVRSGPGQWQVQQLPEGWFGASFILSPEGTPLVTRVEDPWTGSPLMLWEQHSGTWRSQATLGAKLRVWPGIPALRRSTEGQLHALLETDEAYPQLVHAWDSGGWKLQPLNIRGRVLTQPGFALSPRGEAHFAYWEDVEGRWTLTWQAASSPAERVHALECCGSPTQWPTGGTEYTPVRLAVTHGEDPGAPEIRHLFFLQPSSRFPGLSAVAYATRGPQGPWESFTLFEDERLKACGDTPPQGPGDTCEGELMGRSPLGLVATDQDVRMLMSWSHIRYELSADCVRRNCIWVGSGHTQESRLELAWMEGGHVQTVPLWEGSGALGPVAAQVDTQGRIHLVSRRADAWLYLLIGSP